MGDKDASCIVHDTAPLLNAEGSPHRRRTVRIARGFLVAASLAGGPLAVALALRARPPVALRASSQAPVHRFLEMSAVAEEECAVFDGWRKNHASSEVALNLAGRHFGDSVERWAECLRLCSRAAECHQVVFQKSTGGCYPMSLAGDGDLDGIGGSNTDFISAHCKHASDADKAPPGADVRASGAKPLSPGAGSGAAALFSSAAAALEPTPAPTAPPLASLFCFSLVVPWTDEGALLDLQRARHAGVFGCDGTAVYSNPAGRFGGVEAMLVDIDLHCERGGTWNTWMNAPIFAKLWETILKDREFWGYAWTVKADPDCVFFPERLRATLRDPELPNAQAGSGLFLNNCFSGMHGPLEVLSRRALEVYEVGRDSCGLPVEEDVYIRDCLQSLNVSEEDRFEILDELDCHTEDFVQAPRWQDCSSGHAAFHPFKSAQEYGDCLARAER